MESVALVRGLTAKWRRPSSIPARLLLSRISHHPTNSMGRRILAVVAGIVTAFILVMLIEWLGHLIIPPPEGIDPADPESIRAMMDQISPLSLIMVAIA